MVCHSDVTLVRNREVCDMATIRKRAPGQWQAQVRKRGYPLQTKTFPTRASAARWAQTVEYEITQGMFISRSKAESTTLRELLVP